MTDDKPTNFDTLEERLRRIGALKSGHFLLASGRHSDQYVEKFDLLRRPAEVELVCRGFTRHFRDEGINVVVGPTTGGILLAYEVARQLGVAAAYAERKADNSAGREIRRGTTFDRGARVLVVDDVLTTGGSVRETLSALEDHRVVIVAVGVLVDRSVGAPDFGVPLVSLLELNTETWPAGSCPRCAGGTPLVKPGTTVPV